MFTQRNFLPAARCHVRRVTPMAAPTVVWRLWRQRRHHHSIEPHRTGRHIRTESVHITHGQRHFVRSTDRHSFRKSRNACLCVCVFLRVFVRQHAHRLDSMRPRSIGISVCAVRCAHAYVTELRLHINSAESLRWDGVCVPKAWRTCRRASDDRRYAKTDPCFE